MIGATTENPSFEVINALLSRCQVYILNALDKKDLKHILNHALDTDILFKKKILLEEDEAIIELDGGDARKLLSVLELVVQSKGEDTLTITIQVVLETVQTNRVLFDKNGDPCILPTCQ